MRGRAGADCYFRCMFDRIMENSMAMWMLVSALFPIFLFGTIIKAVLHFRRLRVLKRLGDRPGDIRGLFPAPVTRHDRVESEDWVPSR